MMSNWKETVGERMKKCPYKDQIFDDCADEEWRTCYCRLRKKCSTEEVISQTFESSGRTSGENRADMTRRESQWADWVEACTTMVIEQLWYWWG